MYLVGEHLLDYLALSQEITLSTSRRQPQAPTPSYSSRSKQQCDILAPSPEQRPICYTDFITVSRSFSKGPQQRMANTASSRSVVERAPWRQRPCAFVTLSTDLAFEPEAAI